MAILRCPCCDQLLKSTDIRFRDSFPCPFCESGLRVPYGYKAFGARLTVGIFICLAGLLTSKISSALILMALGFVPTAAVVSKLCRLVSPPMLEVETRCT